MNTTERTLLSGALRSVQTMILHGLVSSEAEALAAVEQLVGDYQSLDLRENVGDAPSLRAVVRGKLGKSPALVVHLRGDVAQGAREVLAELTRGVLEIPDAQVELADDVRVIGLYADDKLTPEIAGLFGLQLSGMRVIEEQRAEVRRAEEELLAAQKRARESSRQHGLV